MRRVSRGRADKRYFAKYAKKTKAVNVVPSVGRGGIIL